MNNIYIKKEELNKWVAKYFPMQDLISVDDLLSTIEDLDEIKQDLEDRVEELENSNNYLDEERDREKSVLGI